MKKEANRPPVMFVVTIYLASLDNCSCSQGIFAWKNAFIIT